MRCGNLYQKHLTCLYKIKLLTGRVICLQLRHVTTEFTKSDVNWELARKYYEDSGRADPGDRAMFYWANMIRNLNNWNLFTYSTKVMASIDDTFEFLLG